MTTDPTAATPDTIPVDPTPTPVEPSIVNELRDFMASFQSKMSDLEGRVAAQEAAPAPSQAPASDVPTAGTASPAEVAHVEAVGEGAVGYFPITTAEGVLKQAYLYPDGTIKVP